MVKRLDLFLLTYSRAYLQDYNQDYFNSLRSAFVNMSSFRLLIRVPLHFVTVTVVTSTLVCFVFGWFVAGAE
eukprot:COSAG02_NODE_49_length_45106_cov_298.436177_39_plen_72_part_00